VGVGITLGAHTFIGESGAREQAVWGTDPWAGSGELATRIKPSSPSTAFRCDDFPWDLTEWAPVDWQRPDPDLGRLRAGETTIYAPYAFNIALSTTASRAGVGTITLTGEMVSFNGATRTGTGTITAAGVAATTYNGTSVPRTGVGTITATGTVVGGQAASLAGTGSVTTATRYGRNMTASLSGQGTFNMAATVNTGSQLSLKLAWPNGGGQAACAVSPFSADRVAYGTDTGGVRISNSGITESYVHFLGMNEMRSRQSDGVAWSRIDQGLLFVTCGDGTSGNGGLYATLGGNTRSPGRWVRLDGVASGSPLLIFDGGNNTVAAAPPTNPSYPRHYGGNIFIDDTSIAGFTLIHVATVTNGAWRIKMRNSDLVAVEQVQYAGTSGAFVRCIQMPVFNPNAAGNDYSRIIISLYNRTTPLQPVLCTNANDSSASPTLSTSTITAAPTNVEAMGYAKASGGNAVTVLAGQNYVYFSGNAFSTTASAITMTNMARTTAQADGPENNERWISVGSTVQSGNHIILVGTCDGGRTVGADVNTVWRGVVSTTASTPWSGITWTALRGATYFSEQVMNTAGADYTNWISGQNTPGRDGTAAVSGFTTSTDGARMYLVSRGAAYRSDNYGLNWYATRQWGSADHACVAWDKWINKDYVVTTTGDWAWAAYHDAFVTEPHIILEVDAATGSGVWFDPKTGENFIGGCMGGGTEVPATDAENTVWGIPAASIPNQYTSLGSSPIVDYNLDTGQGPSTAVGGVLDGCTTYGNGGAGTTRSIVVATNGGKGMWYTVNNGTTWVQVLQDGSSGTAAPFTTVGDKIRAVMLQDMPRNRVYVIERANGTVWRCSVNADGTLSTATRLFVKTWTYATAKDSAGYISLDETNDRLWISTLNAVWYINNASTATANSGTTGATASGFATNYPGELAGPMIYSPYYGAVLVATLGLNSAGNMVYNPTLNGADGPRFLAVTNATVSASWNITNAVDWAVTYDRAHRLTYQAPNSISSNWDGSKIALTMQGMGVGVWRAG
jgi:hypothetical protein